MDEIVGKVFTAPVEWLYAWLWRRGWITFNGVSVRFVQSMKLGAEVRDKLSDAERYVDWIDRLGIRWSYCFVREQWMYCDGGSWRRCCPVTFYGPYVEVLEDDG